MTPHRSGECLLQNEEIFVDERETIKEEVLKVDPSLAQTPLRLSEMIDGEYNRRHLSVVQRVSPAALEDPKDEKQKRRMNKFQEFMSKITKEIPVNARKKTGKKPRTVK